jgi:hypothetical protein
MSMTGRRRQQALGLLLLAVLLAGGRIVRRELLLAGAGRWREALWLESALPALPPPDGRSAQKSSPAFPLAVNRLPADSLTVLPGVGPVLAGRIVAERESGGTFVDADDLQRVKGIGPRLAARRIRAGL